MGTFCKPNQKEGIADQIPIIFFEDLHVVVVMEVQYFLDAEVANLKNVDFDC